MGDTIFLDYRGAKPLRWGDLKPMNVTRWFRNGLYNIIYKNLQKKYFKN